MLAIIYKFKWLDNIDQSSNSDVLFNKQHNKDNFLGHSTPHDREVNSDGL